MIASYLRAHQCNRLVRLTLFATFAGGFGLGVTSANHLSWPKLEAAPVDSSISTFEPTSPPETAPAKLAIAVGNLEIASAAGRQGAQDWAEQRHAQVGRIELARLHTTTRMDADEDIAAARTLDTLKSPHPERFDAAVSRTAVTTHIVERGDTLAKILTEAGLERDHANDALTVLSDAFDPRTLQPGQEIRIAMASAVEENAQPKLQELVIDLNFESELQLNSSDGNFEVFKQAKKLDRQVKHAAGVIDDSLYVAAARASIPSPLVLDLVKLFSWDLDFQRDIQPGHEFEIVYEELIAADRGEIRGGPILFAKLDLGGRLLEAYRFTRQDGMVGYYDTKGRSVRKQFMRTPIDGARLSSGFGRRKHPILGYTKIHKGVDFAAPSGTPIYAAGDGTVEVSSRNSGYGNYIRIRHNGEYSTAYAHLSAYAKGIGPGQRVSQGQIIGYVGSTGRSTGPHLHYEVIQNGSQINPMSVKSDVVEHLAGTDLAAFKAKLLEFAEMRRDGGEKTVLARHTE